MTLAIIAGYLLLVLGVGWWSSRAFRGTGEDYFVATRSIGALLLLASLFGTNMTSFSLLGASGEAYRRGIGVFGLMASSTALVAPLVLLTLAPRAWELGRRNGYRTQVELVRDRWGSDTLGTVLFAFQVVLLVPYLMIGIKGGGITLAQITEGTVPEWGGSLVMVLVVLAYVTIGGLRGTAWANALQTIVFMTLGALTFVIVVHNFGGLTAAFQRVAEAEPALLVRGERITPAEFLGYLAVPLSAVGFPHLFLHWLTARDRASFRLPVIAYPLCLAAVWLPSVSIGVLGAVDFPGLEGPQSNSVLILMIGEHAPAVLAGFLAAGVLAAVMSSLDSQSLALANMFTRDVVKHYRGGLSDRLEVLAGRGFVVLVLAVTFVLSIVVDRSLFRLGVWSFSGFAALTPLMVGALFWRRCTLAGAAASLAAAIGTWSVFFAQGHDVPGFKVAGVPPVVIVLGAAAVALVAGSWIGRTGDERVERFFPADGDQV